MQTVELSSGARVSRLGFGCGSLHHMRDAEAARLLDEAVAAGFTHFDTAPSYGFGLGERRLAPLLTKHSNLTVTTKVGLASPGDAKRWSDVIVRKSVGKLIRSLSATVRIESVGRARDSFAQSLRRLGRERVDWLMIYEPEPALLATDEWRRWLEDEQREGRVGAFGLAGTQARILACLAESRSWSVQTEAHPLGSAQTIAAAGGHIDFLYSPLSKRRADISVEETLHACAAVLPKCCLIVSTRRRERLAKLARVFA